MDLVTQRKEMVNLSGHVFLFSPSYVGADPDPRGFPQQGAVRAVPTERQPGCSAPSLLPADTARGPLPPTAAWAGAGLSSYDTVGRSHHTGQHKPAAPGLLQLSARGWMLGRL